MIVQSPQWLEQNPSGFDVCIVGAGPAGITLACELDGSGLSVLLLEAGGEGPDSKLAGAILRGSADAPHAPPGGFRRTGLGGTSSVWGGRMVPYDPIDFEARDHVPDSGWPIGYDEVSRYFPRAMRFAHAGDSEFSASGSIERYAATVGGIPDDALEIIHDRIERYSLPTNFGRSYRAQLEQSRNVVTVLHARCVGLHRRENGSIESIDVADGSGGRQRVRSTTFVLAVGGIETPRLLLASDPGGHGIGNRSGRLGRYYTCHFANVLGRLVANGEPVVFDFEKTRDGVYARRKIQFSAEAQRDHRLLNCVFRLHFPEYSDATHGSAVMSAIFLAKSLLLPEYQVILQHGRQAPVVSSRLHHLRNLVTDMPALFRFAARFLFERVLARRKLPYTLVPRADGSFPLEFNSEQIPQAGNGIRLLQERDRDGVALIHVDWKLSELEVDCTLRAFRLLRDIVARGSRARIEFEDDLAERIRCSPPVGAHHIGTTRMAGSDSHGVVDPDCRVFEAPNLFIAGAATFPTSSHANPTLTIIAMAMRLADTLKGLLGSQRPTP